MKQFLEGSLKALKPLLISGREVLPLVEGGKGISVSNGESSGAWAAAGGIGTFSGVNADSFDDDGNVVEQGTGSAAQQVRGRADTTPSREWASVE